MFFIGLFIAIGEAGLPDNLFLVVFFIYILYGIFIAVAMWRSASKQGGFVAGVVKVWIILSILASLGQFAQIGKQIEQQVEQQISDPESFAKQIAPQAKANLPMQVDDITTWIDIKANGANLIYIYEVKLADDMELDGGIVRDTTLPAVCGDKEAFEVLQTGINYQYKYQREDGTPLTEFSITASDCAANQ